MSKANYEAMTREELREYLRKVNRKDEEAWEVFFDKLDKVKGKVTIPYTEDPQELERNLTDYLERRRKAK
jgi:hypothetical protein